MVLYGSKVWIIIKLLLLLLLLLLFSIIIRSNKGLINAFEHWELRLVQGVSLKILSSEVKGNKTKEMNYSSLIDHCIYFY